MTEVRDDRGRWEATAGDLTSGLSDLLKGTAPVAEAEEDAAEFAEEYSAADKSLHNFASRGLGKSERSIVASADKINGHVDDLQDAVANGASAERVAALHDKIYKENDKLGAHLAQADAHTNVINGLREKYGTGEEQDSVLADNGRELHDSLEYAQNYRTSVLDKDGNLHTDIDDPLTETLSTSTHTHEQMKRAAMNMHTAAGAIEFKFAGDSSLPEGLTLPEGEFLGYGAVYGNNDSHQDVIKPGAFADTIAERKAQGRNSVPMHVMHSIFGGDGLPVGVWKSVSEDAKGLRVHGKISGMNTDEGKMHWERLKDGAYGGFSIGYSVPKGGAVMGKSAGEPKRTIVKANLHEISLVDEPSNALARIDEMKAARHDRAMKAMTTPAMENAASSLASAMMVHRQSMAGGDSPTADERSQMMQHMQDAHEHLTGRRMPIGMKSVPESVRELEDFLRDAGFSNSQARAFAVPGFKLLQGPRDEGSGEANEPEAKAALARDALDFL